MKTNSFFKSSNTGKPLKFCIALALAMAFSAVLTAQPLSIYTQPQSQSLWGGTELNLSVVVPGYGEAVIFPKIDSGTMTLWLKADAGVVSNSAGLVSQWQDQSGNNNHAIQPLSQYQPEVVNPPGINGLAAIRFNGIMGNVKFLQGSGDVSVPDAMTTFTVLDAFTSTNYVNMAWLIGEPARFGFDRSEADYNGDRAFTTWGSSFIPPFIVPTNTYRIWGDRIDTNLSTIELFDATLAESTNFSSAMSNAEPPTAGYYVGGLEPAASPGWNFDGDIAEWIVYQGDLTEPDRLAVMNYLTQKYFEVDNPGPQYQWQLNGTNLLGETNSSLIIPSIQGNQGGIYRVIVSNQTGSIFSSNATVDVKLTPVITSQPASQFAFTGGSASFSVAADGPVPLLYQWTFDGTNLPGATDSVLTISNAQPTNTGTYAVILGTAPNLTTSSNVTLSLYPPNVVSTNLDEDNLLIAMQAGGTVTFATNGVLMVSNTITISNDMVLDGTGHSITLSGGNVSQIFNVQPGVNFALRNLTLANAIENGTTLWLGSILEPGGPSYGGAVFTAGNLNVENCVFSNNAAQSQLFIENFGPGSPAYGGAIYNTGTLMINNSLFISNSVSGGAAQSPHGGPGGNGLGGAIYNSGGMVGLSNVILSGNIAIGAQPPGNTSGFENFGGSAYGGAICTSGGSIFGNNLQIMNNIAITQGGNDPVPGAPNGPPGPCFAGAMYIASGTVTISNSVFSNNSAIGTASSMGGAIFNAGSILLSQCALLGNLAYGGGGAIANIGGVQVEATVLSSNQTLNSPDLGDAIYSLGSFVTDTNTFVQPTVLGNLVTYDWQVNGINISGASLPRFNLTNIQFGIGEIGSVIISSATNSLTLNEIVNVPPTNAPLFAAQPTSESVIVGSTVELTATAVGSPSPAYQWELNGTNVPGATQSVLVLPEVQLSQAGSYTVTASNIYGTNTSKSAVLTLQGIGLTAFTDGNRTLVISSVGSSYMSFVLETSTNLTTWRPVMTNIPTWLFFDTNLSTTPFRFYRAVPSP